jgi:hypothetical protein
MTTINHRFATAFKEILRDCSKGLRIDHQSYLGKRVLGKIKKKNRIRSVNAISSDDNRKPTHLIFCLECHNTINPLKGLQSK